MASFWGLILALEMSANPAFLPPGFYASKRIVGIARCLPERLSMC